MKQTNFTCPAPTPVQRPHQICTPQLSFKPFLHSNCSSLPDPEEWQEERQLKYAPPQQDNGYDCGVFMCHFADCLARDVAFDFDQSMAPDLRLRMALDIQREQLSTE